MDAQTAGVVRSLSHHTPSAEATVRIELLRACARDFAEQIGSFTPSSRERSLAFTHLEDSLMWAIKGIVLEVQ